MTGVPARPRRWRPRWLTTRAIAIGGAFTVAIFSFAFGVAALFAAQAGAGSKQGTPAPITSPADHRAQTPPGTEPND